MKIGIKRLIAKATSTLLLVATLLSVLPTNVFAAGANVDGEGNIANESGAFSQSNYSWRIYLMCSLRGGQAVEQLGVTRDIDNRDGSLTHFNSQIQN